ncbi:DUF4012 domain-containing protein [Microbacterium sp. RURRCA19A]|uniref:DUF4012 domain-containing protein n=1 Tax=Microbacterium sp. RURRCA19A TaxID=1907391 RepID=UPI000954E634|nr:DUF4012 domain-containing protein [Microbacterium sp. RURRCA19A]SIR78720.1 Protein of unknown function [Microbacterium sp. RURRCA19A]
MGDNLRRHNRDRATTGTGAEDAVSLDGSPADTEVIDPVASAPRRRRVWPWVVGGAVGLIGGAAAVAGILGATLAVQAVEVRDDLLAAKATLGRLGSLVEAKDEAGLQAAADDVSERTARAAQTVQSPLWQTAADIPVVGANIDAVSRVTRAVDILVRDALPPGMQMIADLDIKKLALEGGGFDLQPLQQAQASIPVVSQAFTAAKAETDGIQSDQLMDAVAGPVSEIRDVIDRTAPTLDVVNRYLPTLLSMAGGEGSKTYLIIFQNNAEIRATGGNPAASIIMKVDQGKFELLDQASSATFYEEGTAGEQFSDIPGDTLALYPSTFARYSQDYTMTPNFPTTVQLFQDLWTRTNGERFDGVISIDPVVLSHMLAVAGPVDVAGEQITSENAVKLLLSDAYERFPNGADSDRFFSEVSRAVFSHLTSGKWDPAKMLDALTQSAGEQRLLLSFTDEAAQRLSTELGLDGALRSDNTTATQVGTYLNDYSVGKLEYHLAQSVAATCDASARTITTTTTLTNSIPDSIKSKYTLGARNGRFGLPSTSMMLDVVFFAPPGGQIVSTDPATSEESGFDRSGSQNGNSGLSRLVVVPQGGSRTVSSTVKLPDGPLGPLQLRHTPTASDTPVTVDPSCDALFAPAG